MIKKYNLNVNLSKDLITNKSNVNYLKRYKMFNKVHNCVQSVTMVSEYCNINILCKLMAYYFLN